MSKKKVDDDEVIPWIAVSMSSDQKLDNQIWYVLYKSLRNILMVPKVKGIGIQEINSIFCLCHRRHALILVIEHGCQHGLWKLGQGANVGLENLPTDVDSDDRFRHFEIIEIR